MFTHRAQKNKETVNKWFFNLSINSAQLQSLNWDVKKLQSYLLRMPLHIWLYSIVTTESSEYHIKLSHLFESIKTLESHLSEKRDEIEEQIYVLAQCAISFNEVLFNRLLLLAAAVTQNTAGWEQAKQNPYWFLIEKTPYYWFNYLYSKYYKGEEVQHPNLELSQKLRKLQRFEKRVLEFLGAGNRIMSEYDHFMKRGDDKDITAALKLLGIIERNQLLIQQILALNDIIQSEDESELPAFDLSSFKNPTRDIKIVYQQLLKNLENAVNMEERVTQFIAVNARPPTIVSKWLKYTLVSVGTISAIYTLYKNRTNIFDWIWDAWISVFNFWKRYLEQPLMNMYRTIRYDTSSFQVIDQSAMDADIESLGRMVVNFLIQESPELTSEQILALEREVFISSLPELSFLVTGTVRPLYEQSIQKPIQNALFGNLIQLMLIQVHKQRVDIERAMFALDKLLRANELNFQVLALVPAVLVTVGALQFVTRFIFKRVPKRAVYSQVRSELRVVERLLNLSLPDYGGQLRRMYKADVQALEKMEETAADTTNQMQLQMSLENTGRLLLSLDVLKRMSHRLPPQKRDTFTQDLLDLESEDNNILTRLSTIYRMYHTHSFLVVKPITV